MKKTRIIAGILSFIVLFTTIFTGNVVTKAEESGAAVIDESNYADGNYNITGEAATEYSSIVIPNGCNLRIEKSITVTGAVTIMPGGYLEVVGSGAVTCAGFIASSEAEGPNPEVMFEKNSNVPNVNGATLPLYEYEEGENDQRNLVAIDYTDWNWLELRYDYDIAKWTRFNRYDEFGPASEGDVIVELALMGYNRGGNEDFPITPDGVANNNIFDGGDRIKVRVSGESLTIKWSDKDTNQPKQICVEGAGPEENGEPGWLIVDVEENQTSYQIATKEKDRDFYYVEIKYQLDGENGKDDNNNVTHDIVFNVNADVSAFTESSPNFGLDICAYREDEQGNLGRIDGAGNYTGFSTTNNKPSVTAHVPDDARVIEFRVVDAGQVIESISYTIGSDTKSLTQTDIDKMSSSGYAVRIFDNNTWVTAISISVKIVPSQGSNGGDGNNNPGDVNNNSGDNNNGDNQNEGDNQYPEVTDANIFVDSNMGGMIGELKFNDVTITMNRRGTKGAQKVTAASQYTVSIQLEFGTAASSITINNTKYSGDSLTAAFKGEDRYEFTVSATEDGFYNIEFEEAESTVSTIIWTYNQNDPNGPNGDTYSEDALVQHGKVEIVTITRGEQVLYNEGTYGEGVDPEKDSVYVDINDRAQRGYVRLEKGDDIVIRLIPDYGYQLTQASINDRNLTPKSDKFSDVSTFILENVQGQMHFSGVFSRKDDTINNSANNVSSATISNGENAVNSGNLKLDITDTTLDSKAVGAALQIDEDGDYTALTTLGMDLTNVVSMGPDKGNWTNPVEEFNKEITVSLDLTGINLRADQELVVVRKHGDEYEVLNNVELDGAKLQVATNKFSTYTLVIKQLASIKVSYELNGGKNSEDNPTIYIAQHGDVELKQPTKQGSQFEGWYLDSEFKTPISSLTDSLENDITLYAKWKFLFDVYGYKLSLRGNFDFTCVMKLSEEVRTDKNSYIEYTVGNRSDTIKHSATADSLAYYTMEVPVKNIGDTVKARLYYDGKYYEMSDCSVKEYLEVIYMNEEGLPDYTYAREIVEAILTYAAYAQIYFNYNTDSLANTMVETDGVKESEKKDIIEAIDVENILENTNEFSYVGTSLICESDTCMRIYLKNDEYLTCDDRESKYSVTVMDRDGVGYDLEYEIGIKNGKIFIEVKNIPALILNHRFDITINKSKTGIAFDGVFSPYAYIASGIKSKNEALSDLCTALYLYSREAARYVKNVSESDSL